MEIYILNLQSKHKWTFSQKTVPNNQIVSTGISSLKLKAYDAASSLPSNPAGALMTSRRRRGNWLADFPFSVDSAFFLVVAYTFGNISVTSPSARWHQ